MSSPSRYLINAAAFVIVIAGLISLPGLPIAQYPEITPPTVAVSTVYPGANAEVVAEIWAAVDRRRLGSTPPEGRNR